MQGKNKYPWLMLISCCALAWGIGSTYNVFGQYFVSVAGELGVGIGQISLFLTLHSLSSAFTTPFVARIMERVPVRLLLSGSFGLYALIMSMMSRFGQVWHWYIAGAVMGLCMSFFYMVPIPLILNNWFHRRAGFAVGLAMAFAGISGAVMNPIVAMLVSTVGWRSTYLLNGAVAAAVVLPFTLFVIRFRPEDVGAKPYGHGEAAEEKSDSGLEPGAPILSPIRTPAFWIMTLVFGCVAYTSCYAQQFAPFVASLGLSASIGGTMTSLCMVGNTIGKMTLGMIHDKLGAKPMATIGLGTAFIAFLMLLSASGSVPVLFFASTLCGVTLALVSVSLPLLAGALFPGKAFGTAFAQMSVGRSLIGAAGVSVIGFLYDITGSYSLNFIIGAVMAMAAILLTYVAFGAARRGNTGTAVPSPRLRNTAGSDAAN